MDERTIRHAEAMLKDSENFSFIGDVIDQLKIGRTASTCISRRTASGSPEMSMVMMPRHSEIPWDFRNLYAER